VIEKLRKLALYHKTKSISKGREALYKIQWKDAIERQLKKNFGVRGD